MHIGEGGEAVIIGVPKEIKTNEYRVSITPPAVDALVSKGHQIIIETRAGARSSGYWTW